MSAFVILLVLCICVSVLGSNHWACKYCNYCSSEKYCSGSSSSNSDASSVGTTFLTAYEPTQQFCSVLSSCNDIACVQSYLEENNIYHDTLSDIDSLKGEFEGSCSSIASSSVPCTTSISPTSISIDKYILIESGVIIGSLLAAAALGYVLWMMFHRLVVYKPLQPGDMLMGPP
jgi:hypothetical protein